MDFPDHCAVAPPSYVVGRASQRDTTHSLAGGQLYLSNTHIGLTQSARTLVCVGIRLAQASNEVKRGQRLLGYSTSPHAVTTA